jgi:hypothetical protein
MHSVIKPVVAGLAGGRQLTMLCFLLLTMASQSSLGSSWGALAASDSQDSDSSSSVLPQLVTSRPSLSSSTQQSTGLERLKEVLIMDEQQEKKASVSESQSQSHSPPAFEDEGGSKQVKYASGLWLKAQKLEGDRHSNKRRRKRSSFNFEAGVGHSSSSWRPSSSSALKQHTKLSSHQQAKSELQHRSSHVPLSWPLSDLPDESMTSHLQAAGRDMAVQMMSKRRGQMGSGPGRMYDVPQIGKQAVQNHRIRSN